MIAVCVIAYNRPDSLSRVLESIDRGYYGGDKVDLIISIDKSDVTSVLDIAKSFEWANGEKRVVEHKMNLGLKAHVLSCGEFLNEYDALIVLEDDISVAESFYMYARSCVDKYSNDDDIAGISLYNFPLNFHCRLPFYPLHTDSDVYLMQIAQSWGQVWMKNQWFSFKEWLSKNDEEFDKQPWLPGSICRWPKTSWLKHHIRYCIENNKFFVYPYVSLSTNNSDKGQHAQGDSTIFQSNMLMGVKTHFNLNPSVHYDAFFENLDLCHILKMNEGELCVDFYGMRDYKYKQYYLTCRKLDFRIVACFELALKPYESNVIHSRKGNQLFLYDTYEKEKNCTPNLVRTMLDYLYNVSLGSYVKKCFQDGYVFHSLLHHVFFK